MASYGFIEFGTQSVDRFEGIVLEDLLTDFIPEIFLQIDFERVGRQE
jgi:hypothetical protein